MKPIAPLIPLGLFKNQEKQTFLEKGKNNQNFPRLDLQPSIKFFLRHFLS